MIPTLGGRGWCLLAPAAAMRWVARMVLAYTLFMALAPAATASDAIPQHLRLKVQQALEADKDPVVRSLAPKERSILLATLALDSNEPDQALGSLDRKQYDDDPLVSLLLAEAHRRKAVSDVERAGNYARSVSDASKKLAEASLTPGLGEAEARVHGEGSTPAAGEESVDDGGLSNAEALLRLARDGPNEIPERGAAPIWRRFARQLVQFFALMLWVAGALSFMVGEATLGVAIFSVVEPAFVPSINRTYGRGERTASTNSLVRLLPEPCVRTSPG